MLWNVARDLDNSTMTSNLQRRFAPVGFFVGWVLFWLRFWTE
ncbi:hypothetical protein TR2A62_3707 [Thalassobium sp. R2A62]|nr:hypothetical protein TR2A62_3707 [Thalassobium sp. R2A62]